uniref:Uncharacterized protein n=1 Tax=Methanococcus maripaludis (strain C6 / ATCC BAA-1332) TaxID=444158 RepID=A9A9S3_METM6
MVINISCFELYYYQGGNVITWNLQCPKCNKRMTYQADVCICKALEVEIPNCESCNIKMEVDVSGLRGRRRVKK